MTEQMPQYPATSGPTPPGTAGPPQVSPKKEWPWLLIAGIGCLVLLGLAGLLVVLGAAVFWMADVRIPPSAPRVAVATPPVAVAVPSAGTVPFGGHAASPYAYSVTRWTYGSSGAISGSDAFRLAMEAYVFDQHGARAERDIGTVTGFNAEMTSQEREMSGSGTVELSTEFGKTVKLAISFKPQPEGGWEFTLDKYEGP